VEGEENPADGSFTLMGYKKIKINSIFIEKSVDHYLNG